MTRRLQVVTGTAPVVVSAVAALHMAFFSGQARAESPAQLSGRWVSPPHVTFTNPAYAGSAFHLDITVNNDGSFQGTWDTYMCFSYPGAYGSSIISCSLVKKPAKVRGKLNANAATGEIDLEKVGKSSFTYKLGKELVFDLPKNWQAKGGDPVLYTSKLTRPSEKK